MLMKKSDPYQILFWVEDVLCGCFWFVYETKFFGKRLAPKYISTVVFAFVYVSSVYVEVIGGEELHRCSFSG